MTCKSQILGVGSRGSDMEVYPRDDSVGPARYETQQRW